MNEHRHVHCSGVTMTVTVSQITGVSIVHSTVCSGTGHRKHQSSASLAFVRAIHRWPVKFPAQRASNAEKASIWWRHHVMLKKGDGYKRSPSLSWCKSEILTRESPWLIRGRFKKAFELLNLRALKLSPVNKMQIFQCMGKIFCVEFQREPLKFHTKYLTHTLKDAIFKQRWNFKRSWI